VTETPERLKIFNHKGASILACDFSHCDREEGKALLEALVKRLRSEPGHSVRLLVQTKGATHDPSQSTEWKRHLELFNDRLAKTAVTGLSPLNRMAMSGVRMYARLVGQESAIAQAKIFDSRETAVDYLAS
jgi:hypothetical protein